MIEARKLLKSTKEGNIRTSIFEEIPTNISAKDYTDITERIGEKNEYQCYVYMSVDETLFIENVVGCIEELEQMINDLDETDEDEKGDIALLKRYIEILTPFMDYSLHPVEDI